MPNYRVSRQLEIPAPAARVQRQIQDVQRYPEYLPGCLGAGVLQEHSDGVTAWLELQGLGRRVRIVTRNHYSPNRVRMRMQQGPLKQLHGCWTLTPLSESSVQVALEVHLQTSWLPLPGALLEREADRLAQAMRRWAMSDAERDDGCGGAAGAEAGAPASEAEQGDGHRAETTGGAVRDVGQGGAGR